MKVLGWGQTGLTSQSGTLGFKSLFEFLRCLDRDEIGRASCRERVYVLV